MRESATVVRCCCCCVAPCDADAAPLAPGSIVDGVTLRTGDAVLLVAGTAGGVWIADTPPRPRPLNDIDVGVYVLEGARYAGSTFTRTTPMPTSEAVAGDGARRGSGLGSGDDDPPDAVGDDTLYRMCAPPGARSLGTGDTVALDDLSDAACVAPTDAARPSTAGTLALGAAAAAAPFGTNNTVAGVNAHLTNASDARNTVVGTHAVSGSDLVVVSDGAGTAVLVGAPRAAACGPAAVQPPAGTVWIGKPPNPAPTLAGFVAVADGASSGGEPVLAARPSKGTLRLGPGCKRLFSEADAHTNTVCLGQPPAVLGATVPSNAVLVSDGAGSASVFAAQPAAARQNVWAGAPQAHAVLTATGTGLTVVGAPALAAATLASTTGVVALADGAGNNRLLAKAATGTVRLGSDADDSAGGVGSGGLYLGGAAVGLGGAGEVVLADGAGNAYWFADYNLNTLLGPAAGTGMARAAAGGGGWSRHTVVGSVAPPQYDPIDPEASEPYPGAVALSCGRHPDEDRLVLYSDRERAWVGPAAVRSGGADVPPATPVLRSTGDPLTAGHGCARHGLWVGATGPATAAAAGGGLPAAAALQQSLPLTLADPAAGVPRWHASPAGNVSWSAGRYPARGVAAFRPKLWLRARDLISASSGTVAAAPPPWSAAAAPSTTTMAGGWPSPYGGRYGAATFGCAGAAGATAVSPPTVQSDAAEDGGRVFVRFNGDAVLPNETTTTGNYADCGAQTLRIGRRGLTVVATVRFRTADRTMSHAVDFGWGESTQNIVIGHNGSNWFGYNQSNIIAGGAMVPMRWETVAFISHGKQRRMVTQFGGTVDETSTLPTVDVSCTHSYIAESWWKTTDAYADVDVSELVVFERALTGSEVRRVMTILVTNGGRIPLTTTAPLDAVSVGTILALRPRLWVRAGDLLPQAAAGGVMAEWPSPMGGRYGTAVFGKIGSAGLPTVHAADLGLTGGRRAYVRFGLPGSASAGFDDGNYADFGAQTFNVGQNGFTAIVTLRFRSEMQNQARVFDFDPIFLTYNDFQGYPSWSAFYGNGSVQGGYMVPMEWETVAVVIDGTQLLLGIASSGARFTTTIVPMGTDLPFTHCYIAWGQFLFLSDLDVSEMVVFDRALRGTDLDAAIAALANADAQVDADADGDAFPAVPNAIGLALEDATGKVNVTARMRRGNDTFQRVLGPLIAPLGLAATALAFPNMTWDASAYVDFLDANGAISAPTGEIRAWIVRAYPLTDRVPSGAYPYNSFVVRRPAAFAATAKARLESNVFLQRPAVRLTDGAGLAYPYEDFARDALNRGRNRAYPPHRFPPPQLSMGAMFYVLVLPALPRNYATELASGETVHTIMSKGTAATDAPYEVRLDVVVTRTAAARYGTVRAQVVVTNGVGRSVTLRTAHAEPEGTFYSIAGHVMWNRLSLYFNGAIEYLDLPNTLLYDATLNHSPNERPIDMAYDVADRNRRSLCLGAYYDSEDDEEPPRQLFDGYVCYLEHWSAALNVGDCQWRVVYYPMLWATWIGMPQFVNADFAAQPAGDGGVLPGVQPADWSGTATIVGNDAAAYSPHVIHPRGQQFCALQGDNATVAQTVSGFAPGREYVLAFYAVSRPWGDGSLGTTIHVTINDGAVTVPLCDAADPSAQPSADGMALPGTPSGSVPVSTPCLVRGPFKAPAATLTFRFMSAAASPDLASMISGIRIFKSNTPRLYFPFDADLNNYGEIGGPSAVGGTATVSTTETVFGTGGSLALSGGNWLDLSTPFALTGDFTVRMWMRHTSTIAEYGRTFLELGFYHNGLFLRSLPSHLEFFVNGYGYNLAALADDTWYYICLVRASGTLRVYVGTLANAGQAATESASVSTSAVINSGLQNTRLGAARHYDGQFTVGYIDDFEIWNGVARPDAGTVPSAALSV